ncbi:ORC-CDC6 family AAA ATPase [Ralstonia pseudosolanacearum]|uniref:ORC-CDC6 family AAA ATPase n=1 Tax=Ralstonia pseudosolanacearum TaxID=1310165 RepID=UPI00339366D5
MTRIERTSLAINAEAFNAKYLEPAEVAHGFVYSTHFEQLAGDYHAVLIGPRGSGKTTLLKMLQPSALATWTGPKADAFRAAVKYSGVFIASDISWSKQLNSLGYGKLNEENHRTLVLACFTTHVVHAVLETMASRANSKLKYRAVTLSADKEALLARELASALRVKPEIPSLLAVRQALRNRLSDVRVLANACSLLSHEQCSERLASYDYLHLDFLDICSNICATFNEAVGEAGARWGLLFDELETAPDWIVDQLFSALRTSDPRLYLKLAISPVSATAYKALFKQDGASLGNDYQQIRLWYSDRTESKAFCRALWSSLTQKHGLSITAEEALGRSVFEPKDNRGVRRRSPYSPGEHWHKVFTSLVRKDRSFANFLRQRDIDLSAAESMWANKRDSVLRKAAPVAALRDFFLHQSRKGEVAPRQRKTLEIYTGVDSIFAITEGNPRWFISLASPLINFLVRSGERKVPNSEQASEIDAAADRLIALLKTIPVEHMDTHGDDLPLDALLEEIGARLHAELVNEQFSMDPVQSFVVDERISERTQALLASAVNRGAVMLVDESSSKAIVGEMLNSKLRLSFLLAAKYGLLLRKGKAVRLSSLLPVRERQPLKREGGPKQLSLDMD